MKRYNVIIKQLDFTFVLLNQVSSIFENRTNTVLAESQLFSEMSPWILH